jgi:hypothetical protein
MSSVVLKIGGVGVARGNGVAPLVAPNLRGDAQSVIAGVQNVRSLAKMSPGRVLNGTKTNLERLACVSVSLVVTGPTTHVCTSQPPPPGEFLSCLPTRFSCVSEAPVLRSGSAPAINQS